MVTMQIILNNNTNNIFMVAMAFLHLSLPNKYAKRVTVIWSRASCDIIYV